MQKMPRARRSGLIVKEADGEVLIYDNERHEAHCLNETAARVWQYCDGETSVGEACELLSREVESEFDEKLIWYAVDQFSRDNLLEAEAKLPAFMAGGMSRRQMVRTLGLTAAIGLPLVSSILAPTPAQAATLFPPGSPCTAPIQCTSGICCTPATVPACPAGTCSP